MKQKLLLLAGIFLCTLRAIAFNPDDTTKNIASEKELEALLAQYDSIENSLHYKTGAVTLGNGIATINVPGGFKFLDATEAKYVVQDLWNNPPSSEPVLGLLLPAGSSVVSGSSYAFIIQFSEMGYVKDKDANDIDYDDLLVEMKKGQEEDNKQRAAMGYTSMNLIGWAAKPRYDNVRKILYWAKEYKVDGDDQHTLNYDIRLLGRKGVLNLQAVGYMDQLDSVNKDINAILAMVNYNEGHRYADFDSKTDNVAAWTIGGLVAGKVLAKVGFFAVIGKFLKFIVIGFGLLGAAIWRGIKGRKKQKELVYEPVPNQQPGDTPPTI